MPDLTAVPFDPDGIDEALTEILAKRTDVFAADVEALILQACSGDDSNAVRVKRLVATRLEWGAPLANIAAELGCCIGICS